MNKDLNHVAIIMDGNGRWAKKNDKPRTYGHAQGIHTINSIVKCALNDKVKFLTLFAFSTENWNRPEKEVNFIINALKKEILKKTTLDFLMRNEIKFIWLGFEDKLPTSLVKQLKKMMINTKNFNKMMLTIAFNYSGKKDMVYATNQYKKSQNEDINDSFEKYMLSSYLPQVDLLIRTGNEKRISNFLIWQLAYSEIIFEEKMWPEYDEATWKTNLDDFFKRDRRFGEIKE